MRAKPVKWWTTATPTVRDSCANSKSREKKILFFIGAFDWLNHTDSRRRYNFRRMRMIAKKKTKVNCILTTGRPCISIERIEISENTENRSAMHPFAQIGTGRSASPCSYTHSLGMESGSDRGGRGGTAFADTETQTQNDIFQTIRRLVDTDTSPETCG